MLKVYKFEDGEEHWMIAENVDKAFALYNEYVYGQDLLALLDEEATITISLVPDDKKISFYSNGEDICLTAEEHCKKFGEGPLCSSTWDGE